MISRMFPQSEHAALTLARLATAIALPRSLRVAADIKLGEYLEAGPRTLDQIATHYGFDRTALSLFLDVLVSHGIIELEDGEFSSTLLSDQLPLINHAFTGVEEWDAWSLLETCLKTGTETFTEAQGLGFYPYLENNPDKLANWHEWNRLTTELWLADIVDDLPIGESDQVCDLGGGDGALLEEIVRTRPGCTAMLVERRTQPRSTHYETRTADIFKSVPSSHSVYLLSRVCCNFDDQSVSKLFTNIAKVLPPKGKLIVIDGLMPDPRSDKRASVASNSLALFLLFGSRIRSIDEFEQLFEGAELKLSHVSDQSNSTPLSVMIAGHI